VKLYFYRDRTTTGLAEPASYRVQYHNGTTWVDVPSQAKNPAVPRANYNQVQFPVVTAQRFRVVMTHQSGRKTALKEVQFFRTGATAPPAVDVAPYAVATVDYSFRQAGQAQLTGEVKDDALPKGTLTARWTKVSGPGTVIFGNPREASTLATFTKANWHICVVTNQSGIARGFFNQSDLDALHAQMRRFAHLSGGRIDAFYSCPYHEQSVVSRYRMANHPDRKPNPGMLLKALHDHDADACASLMVGDKPSDIEAGQRAGVRAFRFNPDLRLDDFLARSLGMGCK